VDPQTKSASKKTVKRRSSLTIAKSQPARQASETVGLTIALITDSRGRIKLIYLWVHPRQICFLYWLNGSRWLLTGTAFRRILNRAHQDPTWKPKLVGALAVLNGKVLGSIFIFLHKLLSSPVVVIDPLTVHPSTEGGIGRALMVMPKLGHTLQCLCP
jgi:hypothetical protein